MACSDIQYPLPFGNHGLEVNSNLDVCMAAQNSVEILELAQNLHTVNRREIPGRVGG